MAISVDGADALRSLDWEQDGRAQFFSLDRYYRGADRQEKKAPKEITGALLSYFDGDLGAILNLRTALPGTPFQRAVWTQLCQIPAGVTCNYGDIARRLGNPGAMRAVGMANNANPIALVVPCHRVIGANGKMVGYGSGVRRKEWLLRHEGAIENRVDTVQYDFSFH